MAAVHVKAPPVEAPAAPLDCFTAKGLQCVVVERWRSSRGTPEFDPAVSAPLFANNALPPVEAHLTIADVGAFGRRHRARLSDPPCARVPWQHRPSTRPAAPAAAAAAPIKRSQPLYAVFVRPGPRFAAAVPRACAPCAKCARWCGQAPPAPDTHWAAFREYVDARFPQATGATVLNTELPELADCYTVEGKRAVNSGECSARSARTCAALA